MARGRRNGGGTRPGGGRIEPEAMEPAEQGHLAKADDLFRRTLDLDLRALGDGHSATAVACRINAAILARHEAALALSGPGGRAVLRDCRRFIVPG